MSRSRLAAVAPVLVSLACASAPPAEGPAAAGGLPRAAPGVLYSIGASLGEEVQTYQLDEGEVREVARGMSDAALGKPTGAERTEEVAVHVGEFHEARLKELARREELAGGFLLEQAEREPGAVKSETGMVLRVIEPGSGPKPTIFDYVSVNWKGTLRDGSAFLSNEGKPPERSQLGVNTRCWQEALADVAAGARLHVVCPPELSYGWGGWPGMVPGGAVLSYDLELVSIEQRPPPPNWQPDWDVKPQPPIGSPKPK
jgi:FKBP-type peptidyl-prolyl cis-trans isomerase FkpA